LDVFHHDLLFESKSRVMGFVKLEILWHNSGFDYKEEN